MSQQGGTNDISSTVLGNTSNFRSLRIENPNTNPSPSYVYDATSHTAQVTSVAHSSNLVTSGTGLQVAITIETVSALAVTLEIDYVKIRTVELARGGYGG